MNITEDVLDLCGEHGLSYLDRTDERRVLDFLRDKFARADERDEAVDELDNFSCGDCADAFVEQERAEKALKAFRAKCTCQSKPAEQAADWGSYVRGAAEEHRG